MMKHQYRKKSKEERKEEIERLSEMLVSGISAEIASGNIQRVLDTIARFQYDYSLNNMLLIMLQNPEATTVASYTHWKQVNRQVEKGQQGIKILCPMKYKYELEEPVMDVLTNRPLTDSSGNIITEKKAYDGIRFKVGHVFDISQTAQIEGKEVIELEYVKNLQGNIEGQYNDLLSAVSAAAPVPIEIEKLNSSANGYFSEGSQIIKVKSGMSQKQTLKTAIHETAHSILHNKQMKCDGNLNYYISKTEDGLIHNRILKDNLTLKEAIQEYTAFNDSDNDIFIGANVSTKAGELSFPIVMNNAIQMDYVNSIADLRESLEVQKALNDLHEFFPQDNFNIPTMRECQAEAVAYIVAAHFGVDTGPYSIKYIASWSNMDSAVVMKNLEAIKACSSEIIAKMDEELERIHQEKQENDAMTLASEIDHFMKDYDPYEYKDSESYHGSNFDEILQLINDNKTSAITSYLNDAITDDRFMVDEAKQLLKRVHSYEEHRGKRHEIKRVSSLKR